jgi:hypothetical protein
LPRPLQAVGLGGLGFALLEVFSVRLRKSDGCGQGVMHDKGSVSLWDLQYILAGSLDRVEE